MTFTQWFIFFLIIQVIHFLGTWKIYIKAGRKAWEAAVPIYNAIILMQIINRPKWWTVLLFIPIINLLMFPVIWIETIRSFGFTSKLNSFLVIATLGLYIFYINYATDAKYIEERSLKPRSELGEWISSITFAIIAATLVHTYFMQPYTIPTSSLEKTLLVGDFLFVSKFHYGARIPMTTVAAPMVHDTLPFLGKSFLSDDNAATYKTSLKNKLTLPYMRLPGFQKIKRNDIVVFSWPADSLSSMYGDTSGKFTYKPLDKKTNYVKRCVGIAGDSLEIRNGYVFINGKKNELPDRAKLQFFYTYTSKSTINNQTYPSFLKNNERTFVYKILTEYWENDKVQEAFNRSANLSKIGEDSLYTEVAGVIAQSLSQRLKMQMVDNKININLTADEVAQLKKHSQTVSVIKINQKIDNDIFPHIKSNDWSQDNFGPIYIPEAGKTVKINTKTLPYYQQIIKLYENNNLETNGDDIYINGQLVDSYTFKQDYYWMMGDNRHNSLDARYWGYVPFDHVVGKPVLIWFSWNPNAGSFVEKLKSIKWDRMFTTVHGSGKPVSYFNYFLIVLALYFGFTFYQGRKKSS